MERFSPKGIKAEGDKDLFGQLLLAQFVQCIKLACQRDVLQEAAAGQLDTNDDLSVRNHHGDRAELDL